MKAEQKVRKLFRDNLMTEAWSDRDLSYGGLWASEDDFYDGTFNVVEIVDLADGGSTGLVLVQAFTVSFDTLSGKDWRHVKDYHGPGTVKALRDLAQAGDVAKARAFLAAVIASYGMRSGVWDFVATFDKSWFDSEQERLEEIKRWTSDGRGWVPAESVPGWGYAAIGRAVKGAIDRLGI